MAADTTKARKFQGPKGTRDLYPEDALKRRYLEQAWRDTAIRHGFDEIAGPTFEDSDLYAVKSGDGILNELFQAYSGKSPDEVAQVQASGMAPYALRPEFTPTLARMYVARQAQLPVPCKWFTAGPYFRAERPQRGRLREFLQWNCDVLGLPESTEGSAHDITNIEIIATLVSLFADLGLAPANCRIAFSDRRVVQAALASSGLPADRTDAAFALLDGRSKLPAAEFARRAAELGLDMNAVESSLHAGADHTNLMVRARAALTADFLVPDYLSIVRGLAYYTGLVFEVIAQGERAIAGGGRYDNLIELFGGKPTPAVGFGMGDVVLTNLLEDLALLPTGPDLMHAVSRAPASVRPEAFVLAGGDDDVEGLIDPLVAQLRRGIESPAYRERDARKPWDAGRYAIAPLHTRKSYKSTRNLKKLLADAERVFSRYAVVVHAADKVQLKDFDTRRDLTPKDLADAGLSAWTGVASAHAEFAVNTDHPAYVGRAIADLLTRRL